MNNNTSYIKLHYRGRLKSPAEVRQLVLETEDICRSNGWSYNVWDNDWSKPQSLSLSFTGDALEFGGFAPLKGISFSVGESETVWLTFLPDGLLQSPFTLTNPAFTGDDLVFPLQRVKTGFDGAVTHLAVCKLFRYLEGKYFDVFEVQDESGYWQHNDDARVTAWLESLSQETLQLEEELAAIEADDTLSNQQKRDISYRLLNAFGEKFKPGG